MLCYFSTILAKIFTNHFTKINWNPGCCHLLSPPPQYIFPALVFRLKRKFASSPLVSKFQMLVPHASIVWRKTLCNKCIGLAVIPSLEGIAIDKVNIYCLLNYKEKKLKSLKPKNFSKIFQQQQLSPWSL